MKKIIILFISVKNFIKLLYLNMVILQVCEIELKFIQEKVMIDENNRLIKLNSDE